jgi:hypothetical protein
MRTTGGDRLSLFALNQETGTTVPPEWLEVYDEGNGRYELTLRFEKACIYSVHVFVHGVELKSSPF